MSKRYFYNAECAEEGREDSEKACSKVVLRNVRLLTGFENKLVILTLDQRMMGHSQMSSSPPLVVVSAQAEGQTLSKVEVKFDIDPLWLPLGLYEDIPGTIIAFINLFTLLIGFISFFSFYRHRSQGKMMKHVKYSQILKRFEKLKHMQLGLNEQSLKDELAQLLGVRKFDLNDVSDDD